MNRTLGTLLRAIVQKNLNDWEEYIPFVEFAYNRVVHSTTGYSLFEVVYSFNPLTPLDLVHLPCNERTTLDEKKKIDLVKRLHEDVHKNIEKKNQQIASQVNKGRRRVIFELGDWVWAHMRKERFSTQ